MPKRDRSCDDTPSPRVQQLRPSTDTNLRRDIERWMDMDPTRSRRLKRGNDIPVYLFPLPPEAAELPSSSRPLLSVEYLPESESQLNDRSNIIYGSPEVEEIIPSSRRSYPRKARMQKFRPATRASTEDVEMSAGYETPSEPESASEYQAPSPSSRQNQSTCPTLTLSSGSEVDLDLDSNPASNLRSYSLSHSGSATFTASNSIKWQSSQPSLSSRRSLSTFPSLTLSSGSEIDRDLDSNSVSNFRSSVSHSDSLTFLDSLSRTPQSSSYPPSLPVYISAQDISSAGESTPSCGIMPREYLSQVNGASRPFLRSCLRPTIGQAVSRVGTGNENSSSNPNGVEYDPISQRSRKSVRLCLPHEELMKQENQLHQMIMLRLAADSDEFPDRWDSSHELYHERDLERSDIHDKAKSEAEAEMCERLGIPDLESQMFSAAEIQTKRSAFSEDKCINLLDEPEAHFDIEHEATSEGTGHAPEPEYIIVDESESEVEVEPEWGSAPVVENNTMRARGTVPESIPTRSGDPATQGLVGTITTGVIGSRDGLAETAAYVLPVFRPVHEERRLRRRETPNTRLRRTDQELIRGLEAV